MKTETVCKTNDTTISLKLYLAFELSNTEWKLGFTTGLGQAARIKLLKACNLGGLKLVRKQIRKIETIRKELLHTSEEASIKQVRQLMKLKGIVVNSA